MRSAKKRRPGLEQLTARLERGEILVVAKGDRLARSLSAYVRLIESAHGGGWTIAAADASIDLTTPHGRAMASMAAVFAELERELIGERTRVALEVARSRGTRLGRPATKLPARLRADITRRRGAGESLQTIADRLNARGAPAPLGGRWYPAQVARVAEGAG